MSFDFNADEILAMAEQIERNGALFYRKAAGLVKNAEVNKLLLDLAAWEEGHEKAFASMRNILKERERQPTTFDPEDETSLYLRAMADGHVFDVRVDPTDKLTGKESVTDILRMAIGQEKDSIIFYLGVRDLVSEVMGKDKIDEIIREEMRHIGFLNKQIAASGADPL
ncbi:MAG: ferritin family protein [Deltaproteobacteria bacterium]|nr:MAG: ferritin family protein [Deltaproteobacteria bacterium]